MKRYDNQRVLCRGIYRKQLSAMRMGQPETLFLGVVRLELEGSASDYDSAAWPDSPALVRLGDEPWPEAEADRLNGKLVRVEGQLMLDPSALDPNVGQYCHQRPEATLIDPGPARRQIGRA